MEQIQDKKLDETTNYNAKLGQYPNA